LGILIPPSIGLIIFGVLVEESIGRLYMGGFLPGFLLAFTMIAMMVVTSLIFPRTAPMEEEVRRLYRAWFNGIGVRRYTDEQRAELQMQQATEGGIANPTERAAYRRGRSTLSYVEATAEWLRMLKEALTGLLAIIPVLVIIVVVLGSIYTGWATPTEAAALGVVGALLVAVANELYQRLQGTYSSWGDSMRGIRVMLFDAIISTVRTSSMIMLIVMAAFTLSFAFARLGISQDISEWITGLNLNALQFVIILVFFYLLLGTFMESFAMLVTTIPILAPTLEAVGVDLVWFGIIMVILVEAALISPPEGINLYILHGVRQDVDQQMAEQTAAAQEALRESTITDVYIGVLPFMGCMAAVIALLFVFPDIALWAPCIIYDDPSRDFLQAINVEREAAGFWESVKYCSSEFRPRAYQ
jgi:TRAP-type mannitol/chloroaromatic compound transport system permease large subunit